MTCVHSVARLEAFIGTKRGTPLKVGKEGDRDGPSHTTSTLPPAAADPDSESEDTDMQTESESDTESKENKRKTRSSQRDKGKSTVAKAATSVKKGGKQHDGSAKGSKQQHGSADQATSAQFEDELLRLKQESDIKDKLLKDKEKEIKDKDSHIMSLTDKVSEIHRKRKMSAELRKNDVELDSKSPLKHCDTVFL